MENSFHGRTLATVSATGQPKFQEGFAPLLEGFICVPFNRIDLVAERLSGKTCAVMIELIQAEGGVYPAKKEYVKKLRDMTAGKDILLIIDEVQTGIGRTGKFLPMSTTK